jgi:hypothetical protein
VLGALLVPASAIPYRRRMSNIERSQVVQKLMLSLAAVIFSVAALLYVLRSPPAHALGGAEEGRYQFIAVYEPVQKAFVYYMNDTTTGRTWFNERNGWHPSAGPWAFNPSAR